MSSGSRLRARHGVGADTAAQLLITAGGNPERLSAQSDAAIFAQGCQHGAHD